MDMVKTSKDIFNMRLNIEVMGNPEPSLVKQNIVNVLNRKVQRLNSDRSEFQLGLKIKSSPDGKPRVSAFDGDESNLYAPQSEEVRREVAGLMAAECNIMSAQTNDNIAGVVFDALTAAYILSLPETVVNPIVFSEVRMLIDSSEGFRDLNQRLDKYYVPKNSGRALLSALFPPDFYYQKGETLIRDGILISGVLNKSNIGSSPGSGSIIQALFKDYGQEVTKNFLTNIYFTGGYYMNTHGFSVGLDDCFLTGKDPQKTIKYEIQKIKR